MEPIMLARAAYLRLFTQIAHEIGTPVARELRRARLPTQLGDRPDAYVAVPKALGFARSIERREGIDDLGFLAAQRVECSSLGSHCAGLFRNASTLHDLLRQFARLAPLENTNVRLSMRPEGDDINIGINLLGAVDPEGLRFSEWVQVMVLIKLIREVQGPEWCPSEIVFKSRFAPCEGVLDAFPGAQIRVGRDSTSIRVASALMSRPLQKRRLGHQEPGPGTGTQRGGLDDVLDFPRSLMLALRAYVPETQPQVALAAEIAGTSVRTLQRRLTPFGMSYSRLVQQMRFEAATELLAKPDIRMLDVAHAVGYEDQAHFTRAFRRFAGVSPTEYRRQREHC
jgi:AraC-like DNA-binding protein